MAIVLNDITLPASKMYANMTSLIGDIRFNNTLAPSEIVNDLVSSCRIGKVDYGKGIVNTFKVGLQPVNDLTEESSAFKITKANTAQETITIDKYKVIPLSVNDFLSKDAVLTGDKLNEFFEFVMGLLNDTETFHLFDVCNKMYQDWKPAQASQTVIVKQIDTSTLTGVELESALRLNATEMAKVMRKTVNNMKILNKKYTDVTKYKDENDGTQKDVYSCLSANNTKFVVNDTYWTNFLADAMASVYHNEKLGEMIPGDSFVLIPEDAMTPANAKTIAWLSTKNKFALADFYSLVLSILDPSTGYRNSFKHFSYGNGVFKTAPGVKFVAELVPPTAKNGEAQ